jgi:hypothetical protein
MFDSFFIYGFYFCFSENEIYKWMLPGVAESQRRGVPVTKSLSL